MARKSMRNARRESMGVPEHKPFEAHVDLAESGPDVTVAALVEVQRRAPDLSGLRDLAQRHTSVDPFFGASRAGSEPMIAALARLARVGPSPAAASAASAVLSAQASAVNAAAAEELASSLARRHADHLAAARLDNFLGVLDGLISRAVHVESGRPDYHPGLVPDPGKLRNALRPVVRMLDAEDMPTNVLFWGLGPNRHGFIDVTHNGPDGFIIALIPGRPALRTRMRPYQGSSGYNAALGELIEQASRGQL